MTTSHELEGFFDALSGEGTTEARGLSFTLESEKARRKLREFAMAHPEHFQLLALAGLYALGARHFHLTTDADDFILDTDLELERGPFDTLWAEASGGTERAGLRLIALSLLTSARLDEVEWTLSSRDSLGPWSYGLKFRRGELAQSGFTPAAHEFPGTRFAAKRRSLGQVALRYLGRLRDRLSQRESDDERLVRERLFLTGDSTLTFNGVPIQRARKEGTPLAFLESGAVPHLVECDLVHRRQGKHTAGILLCPPDTDASPDLPGKANHLVWIWNGLIMDETPLGDEFAYFRAFAWAPQLQPDLSLTQLISNNEKQAMERDIKSLARDLLEVYVGRLAATIRDNGQSLDQSPYRTRLEIVKKALRTRISLTRARQRLAALNRALIACPLLVGSDAEGVRRWWSFEDIWEELEAQRPVAAWPSGEPLPVPACPGRPVVLETSREDWVLLKVLLPEWALKNAKGVLGKIQTIGLGLSPEEPPSPDYKGAFVHQEREYRWFFASTLSSCTLVCGGERPARVLTPWEDAPKGLMVRTSWSLEATFSGQLVDTALAGELRALLLTQLASALASCPRGPSEGSFSRAAQELLFSLRGTEPPEIFRRLAWLPVWTQKAGMSRMSAVELAGRLDKLQAPCFEITKVSPKGNLPDFWADLPLVVADSRGREALSALVRRPVVSARPWWTKLRTSPSAKLRFAGNERLLKQECPEGVESMEVQICEVGTLPTGTSWRRDWRGGAMVGEERASWIYPGLAIDVHWSCGWPGCEGEWELGGGEREAKLAKACLLVGLRFLESANPSTLLRSPPDLLATWTFDLLSDPVNHALPLLLSGGGRKVSWNELGESVSYFREPEEYHAAGPLEIYLPGELYSTIELLGEERRWRRHGASSRFAKSRPVEPQAPVQVQPEPQTPESRQENEIAPLTTSSHRPVELPKSPSPQARPLTPPKVQPDPPPPLGLEQPGPLEVDTIPVSDPPPVERAPSVTSAAPLELEEALPPALSGLIRDISIVMPEDKEFIAHLRALTIDLEFPGILRLSGESLQLGKRGWTLCQNPPTRIYLYSALFSFYNRAKAEVSDADEREFHQALVSRLIDGKGTLPAKDKEPPGERTTLE